MIAVAPPGESVSRRAIDPRAALLLTLLTSVVAFFVDVNGGVLLLAILSVLFLAVGRGGSKTILPFAALAFLFGGAVNLFFVRSGEPVTTLPLGIVLTDDGLREAIRIGCRMTSLVFVGAIALRRYGAVTLSEALGRLLSPAARLFGGRVHTMLFQLRLAIAFVPAVSSESARILASQKRRGLRFEGSFIERVRLLPALFVPVWVGAMVRASHTGHLLAARGYRAGRPHRYLPDAHWRPVDSIVLLLGLLAAVWLLRSGP